MKAKLRESIIKIKKKITKKHLLILTGACLGLLILIPVLTFAYFSRDLGDKERIMNRNKSGLVLQDREGKPFFTFYQAQRENYVTLDQIAEPMQQAVIAAEDGDFYTNPGFSIRGITRAFFKNIKEGEIVQGGSTITQELVKISLLSSERSFLRKYQELVLAYELTRRYSKDEILEMYLNSVYFGEGAFGVETAARTYFGVSAKELTLSQASMLAGLLPAPSAYSPVSNGSDKAEVRQKFVLDQMVGAGYISPLEAEEALALELEYSGVRENTNNLAPHFALYVKDMLIEQYGEERVVRSGMEVKTTLNSSWQATAEKTVADQVARLSGSKVSNGAAVAMDPETGEILVMVGSANWFNERFGKVNMAVSPRQPGSAFKPIIYAEAIEDRKVTAATVLEDQQKTFPGDYEPKNYDERYRGAVTVRRALANSLNIPAVEVMQRVGVSDGITAAKDLGISTMKTASDYGLSLVLGAAEVSLLEMTNAYAAFANEGQLPDPLVVLEIKDKYGTVIEKNEPSLHSAVESEVAFIISSILSDANARAEVFGNALSINRVAAVKTGTTNNYRDSWTVGYTPSLVIGVWVGNNDNTAMSRVAGSLGAAPIWRTLMQNFLRGTPSEQFTKPSGIVQKEACALQKTSAEATESARITYMEYFIRGTEDSVTCTLPEPSPTMEASPSPSPSGSPSPQPSPTPETQASPSPTPLVELPLPSPGDDDDN